MTWRDLRRCDAWCDARFQGSVWFKLQIFKILWIQWKIFQLCPRLISNFWWGQTPFSGNYDGGRAITCDCETCSPTKLGISVDWYRSIWRVHMDATFWVDPHHFRLPDICQGYDGEGGWWLQKGLLSGWFCSHETISGRTLCHKPLDSFQAPALEDVPDCLFLETVKKPLGLKGHGFWAIRCSQIMMCRIGLSLANWVLWSFDGWINVFGSSTALPLENHFDTRNPKCLQADSHHFSEPREQDRDFLLGALL